LTAGAVPNAYDELIESVPEVANLSDISPAAFDWALHPGGAAIIKGVEQNMQLTPHHLRASYDVYRKHGNSSSATIFSVMDRLRNMGPMKDYIVGCAFGPGMSIEMAMLKRGS
jgi:type III polyketide synthase